MGIQRHKTRISLRRATSLQKKAGDMEKLRAEKFAVKNSMSGEAEEDESEEATKDNEDAQPDLGDRIQKYIAKGSENLGGNAAWEMASTNKVQLEGAEDEEESANDITHKHTYTHNIY